MIFGDITILGEIVNSRDYFFTNELHVIRNNLKNSQEVTLLFYFTKVNYLIRYFNLTN